MKHIIGACLLLVLAAASLPPAVLAEETGTVVLTTTAETEVEFVDESGQTGVRRVKAAKVVPGDEVVYTIHCTNQGQEPAEDVVITNPIPEHMTYVDRSATGAGAKITFSVDGGETYGSADDLAVNTAKGEERPATAADYTHVRWSLVRPLAPAETGTVSYRAELL
jgi:uncharacterized repeat protein (TIGR01451 family)